MTTFDRRTLLRQILPGAVAAATGVAAIATGGLSVILPNAAEAMPLAIDKTNPLNVDELFQKTQAVIVVPGRRRVRRRRWECWWYRGRNRCGWRWRWVWI